MRMINNDNDVTSTHFAGGGGQSYVHKREPGSQSCTSNSQDDSNRVLEGAASLDVVKVVKYEELSTTVLATNVTFSASRSASECTA
jgi:hypothetical protein